VTCSLFLRASHLPYDEYFCSRAESETGMSGAWRGVFVLALCASCGGSSEVRSDKHLAQTPPDHLQPEEYVAAARDYRRACDDGTAQACGYLGFMYDNGQGVQVDVTTAVSLSTRACAEAGAYGCAYLGYLYQVGRGVPQDAARAATLYRKACDGEDSSGCLLLGIMYKTGSGVGRDSEYAAQLFNRACDDGESLACASLGYMYANGEGVDLDVAHAQALFRTACASGDEIGCDAEAQLARREPVP